MIMTSSQRPNIITPSELQQLLARGSATLIDVRSPAEYASVHVPQARSVPLDSLDASVFLKQHGGNDKPIYVLCQSGGRARTAIGKFRRAGFDGCVLVEGGTQAWIDAGLPVIRGRSQVLPLMRQVQLIVGFVSTIGAVLALTVHPFFAILPLIIGAGLLFAGLTGTCGLALLLARMPWNRVVDCGADACCSAERNTP